MTHILAPFQIIEITVEYNEELAEWSDIEIVRDFPDGIHQIWPGTIDPVGGWIAVAGFPDAVSFASNEMVIGRSYPYPVGVDPDDEAALYSYLMSLPDYTDATLVT